MKKCSLNKIKIFIILSLLELSSFAQPLHLVDFHNSQLKKEFFSAFKFNQDTININSDTLFSALINFLQYRGYYDYKFEIDSIDNNSKKIYLINVNEGNRYLIKNISSFEPDAPQDVISQVSSMFRNTILNKENIQRAGWNIAELLENKGFPFAEIKFQNLRSIEVEDNEILTEVIFSVKKNYPAKISRIEIEGNKFTNRDVIVREMRISENEFFTPQLSQKIMRRLNRLNIFSNVNNPEFFFDDSLKGILKIEVKEGNTNSFDGILGYVPSPTQNEKGYITGQVNVSLRNLFGTLRAFSFRWNKLSRLSQDLEIKYFEPWFFGFPLNITPIFQQFKQDTTYIQRTFIGNFDLSLSESFMILFNFSSGQVIPQANYFITNVNRSSTFSYGLGVLYDSRDNPLFTKSGLLFRTDLNQIIKKEYLPIETKKYNQQKGTILVAIHQPIFRNQVLFLGLNAKVITGDGISISDLFRFGGMNSLRGYEENQFSGSRVFWSNFEYRLFTSFTDYLSVFFDYGYYFRDILNERISKFKFGYGVGAGFNTGLGMFRVNYALGEGDTFNKGKIHFGFVSLF